MQLSSFFSGGFITVIVVNPPERKLAKRTSVQYFDILLELKFGYKVLPKCKLSCGVGEPCSIVFLTLRLHAKGSSDFSKNLLIHLALYFEENNFCIHDWNFTTQLTLFSSRRLKDKYHMW